MIKIINFFLETANIIDCWHKDRTKMWKNEGAESAETVVSTNLTDSVFLAAC